MLIPSFKQVSRLYAAPKKLYIFGSAREIKSWSDVWKAFKEHGITEINIAGQWGIRLVCGFNNGVGIGDLIWDKEQSL